MKKQLAYIILAVVAILETGCGGNYPVQKSSAPREYETGYIKLHGKCYDSIEAGVISLDLYTSGLALDSQNHIQGSGYNLYWSDIFVEDSLLRAGEYSADTTGAVWTFLRGHDYEGVPSGAYLLSIEDGQLQQITLMDSGKVYVRDTLDGELDISCKMYQARRVYEAHFQGSLIPKQDE